MSSQEPIKLNQENIRKVLPHQPPFVFIDEILELVPGESAKATKYVDPKDPVFFSHFPGNPIYPGIFLIEGAGQLAFVTFCYRPGYQNDIVYSKAGYLGAVKSFTFRNIVTPGMTLTIDVKVVARFGNAAKVSARILCEQMVMAEGELYFTVAETEDGTNP